MLTRCWVALLLLSGCAIELDDVDGRACDGEHVCRAPRRCVQNVCVLALENDAGRSDAGLNDAGLTDAGTPRWQQRLHGFTGTTIDTGCTLTIDPSRGNYVVSTVLGAADDRDSAYAELVDLNRLPRTVEGKLRGRFTLPSALQVRGEVPIVFLGTQSGQAWARAGFDAQGRLVVESDAQTLASSALVERFTVDGGFTAGDWVLELAWQAGGFRRVWLNDVLLADTTVSGGASVPPAELDLGIARYDGDAGSAFTVTLSGWQLTDSLEVTLGDVP